jgi:ribosomal protein L37E
MIKETIVLQGLEPNRHEGVCGRQPFAVKKNSWFTTVRFVGSKTYPPRSQQHATCPFPKVDEYTHIQPIIFIKGQAEYYSPTYA